MITLHLYKFRSNSDLCLTGYLREMLPGVIAYGVQSDLNLYLHLVLNLMRHIPNNLNHLEFNVHDWYMKVADGIKNPE